MPNQTLFLGQRVLVIGSGGAGKTTFARRLATRTGLPLIHLDLLYWHPGWIPTPNDEWDRTIAELISRPRWIMDGNYGRTLAVRLAACDTVIFLDFPPALCLFRVLRRRLQHLGRPREDMPEGCPERLSWEFVSWVWTYRAKRRPGILEKLVQTSGHAAIITLRSQAECDAFLAEIQPPLPNG